MSEEEAMGLYATLRRAYVEASYWLAESFTDRCVYSLVSGHLAGPFSNTVGTRNIEGWTPLTILESVDETGRSRFVVGGLGSLAHIDSSKVLSVEYFEV